MEVNDLKRQPFSRGFKETSPSCFQKTEKILDNTLSEQKSQLNKNRPQRILNGMKKCGTSCTACPYVKEGKTININRKLWNTTQKLNCKYFNIVYALKCKKENCGKTYIGEIKKIP